MYGDSFSKSEDPLSFMILAAVYSRGISPLSIGFTKSCASELSGGNFRFPVLMFVDIEM